MLEQAYRLREQLTTLFDRARSKKDGLRRIGYWRARVAKSGLTCFEAFLKLLDTWLPTTSPIARAAALSKG